MNFNLDNLKDEETPQKGSKKELNLQSRIGIVVGCVSVVIIVILAVVIMKFNHTNSNKIDSTEIITTETEDHSLPLNHSNFFNEVALSAKSIDNTKLGYTALEINVVSKVENMVIESGLLDGSMYSSKETLEQYISRIYHKENKTDTESFYCALWEGETYLSDFVYNYLLNKGIITGSYTDGTDYFTKYSKNYFSGYNSLDTNTSLKSELQEYVSEMTKNTVTGFYPILDTYSFVNHVENCSDYVPEGGTAFEMSDKTGKNSFSLVDENGNNVKYYFHQNTAGEIYYNRNSSDEKEKQTSVTYLTRFDSTNFVYYEEPITKSEADVDTLLSMGYSWVDSSTMIKSQNGKTHKLIFK